MNQFADPSFVADGAGDCSPFEAPLREIAGFVVPSGTTMFGKPVSQDGFIAWCVRCGFNPATGKGRFHAGMVNVILPDGQEIGLCWDEPSK